MGVTGVPHLLSASCNFCSQVVRRLSIVDSAWIPMDTHGYTRHGTQVIFVRVHSKLIRVIAIASYPAKYRVGSVAI